MNKIFSKLTSRKLWAAVANFVAMLIVAFGGTTNEATQITALIMAGAGVVAYIVGEGLIDAAAASGTSPAGTTVVNTSNASTADSSGTPEA